MATKVRGRRTHSQVPDQAVSFDDAFHKTIVDNIADGVYYVDRERRITYWNHGAERLTGYSAESMVGQPCYANLLSHVDDSGTELCHAGCPLSATIADGEVREAELWLRHESGHRRPVRVRTAPVRDDIGSISGAIEIFDDASRLLEARQDAEVALRDALTDTLTGLPNRRHFDAALSARLDDLRRYGWSFGLLVADIDHFKWINDDHGHGTGDDVLRVVAATIRGAIRGGDLAARWGGEEFAILVQAAEPDDLMVAAERVRVLVARSAVRVGGRTLTLRVSVGGAESRTTDSAGDLMARADAALYRAKEGGRNRTIIAGDR